MSKRSSTISIQHSQDPISETITSIKNRASELFISLGAFTGATRQERVAGNKIFGSASMPNFDKRKVIQILIPVVFVVILAVIVVALVKKATSPQVAGVSTAAIVAQTTINRDFSFPLKDSSGKTTGKFTYSIKSAEERHQIIVKGQNATSVPGRVFLIINLQIVNGLNQGLSINTRDYIRISVNGDERQWFAPDIHNDPVEAQAISTTITRLGLAVNDSDHDIKLQVGEIDGKKTVIPVSFNK